MADQSISCPSCGKKIPLTRALRAEIEASLKQQFDETLQGRERELRAKYESRLEEDLQRAQADAAKKAEKKVAQELAGLKNQVKDQAKDLEEARRLELSMRKKERELERKQQELELTVAREIDKERTRLVTETQERLAEEHRLKDAEKERQLGDMRRQIEDLKRKAEQGSQQLQGEAGEGELESLLRANFPSDEISAIGQGVRGADVHQIVIDPRGRKSGAILWECKNTKNWSDGWIAKLKQDQRSLRADVAVLVTATLPKGCTRFALIDGVLVTDFACAAGLAAVLRANLHQLAQTRSAAISKEESLELCIDTCLVWNSGTASRPSWRRSLTCDRNSTRSAGPPSVSGRAARVRLMRSPSTSPGCTATCKGWFLPCRRSRSLNCPRRRSRSCWRKALTTHPRTTSDLARSPRSNVTSVSSPAVANAAR